MGIVSVGTLQWTVGAFCAMLGALMLVAPHQFGTAHYTALQPHLPLWGTAFLLAGVGLPASAVLSPPRAVRIVVHLFAGAALLMVARGFIATGGWTWLVNYALLGVGTIVAPFVREPRDTAEASAGRDLFALVMGLSAVLNGLVLFALPDQFAAPMFDRVRPYIPWHGAALVASGLLLTTSELVLSARRFVSGAAHLLTAAALLAFFVTIPLPLRIFASVPYFCGFGAALALRSWLHDRLRRVDPSSLRTRVALALAMAAAIPLILTVALVTDKEEQSTADQIGASQEVIAGSLAQDVADYVGLHRAAVEAVAGQPLLLSQDADQQRAILRAIVSAFPDFLALHMHDADGRPIVRSDDLKAGPVVGLPVFEEARRTNGPSLDVLVSPAFGRPVFALAAPVRGADGGFAGVVIGVLEPSRIVTLLGRTSIGPGGTVYLVDARDRVIAHPDPALAATFADISGTPAVAAMRAQGRPGSLAYTPAPGAKLTSYAPAPGLEWGVVVERPAAAALAGVRDRRDLAFGMLVLVIGVAASFGALAASWLAAPLGGLGHAVKRLASGDSHAPLPKSGIAEVSELAAAFGEMRDQLEARTQELARLEAQRETDRLKHEFVSIVSHELRTPLAGLIGFTELLLTDHGSVADRREWLETMLADALRLSTMVEELLDVSRIEGGGMAITWLPVDVRVAMDAALAVFRTRLGEYRIEKQYREPLPAVLADPDKLGQVLTNLIANAIKYSPDGGTVTLAAEAENGSVRLSVSDHGLGIPAEEMPRLFGRFHRVHDQERQSIEGTGLGLYIAKQLVDLLGGRIWAESPGPGLGSTFYVELAVAKESVGV